MTTSRTASMITSMGRWLYIKRLQIVKCQETVRRFLNRNAGNCLRGGAVGGDYTALQIVKGDSSRFVVVFGEIRPLILHGERGFPRLFDSLVQGSRALSRERLWLK